MGAGELDPKDTEVEAIPLRPSLFPRVPPYILFTSLGQKFDSTIRTNENIEVDSLDGHGMDWHVRRSGLVWPVVLQTARQAGYTTPLYYRQSRLPLEIQDTRYKISTHGVHEWYVRLLSPGTQWRPPDLLIVQL